MKTVLSSALQQAKQLVRAQNVIEATRVIQRALSGSSRAPSSQAQLPDRSRSSEPQTNGAGASKVFELPSQDAGMTSASARDAVAEGLPAARMKRPLGEVLKLLRQTELPRFDPDLAPLLKFRKAPPVPVPDGAAYLCANLRLRGGFERL